MLNELDSEDRLRLVRFVCALGWADLEVPAAERNFVHRLVRNLGLSEDEMGDVEGWLASPPDPEDIDPQDVPEEHRELFLLAVKAMVASDGKISRGEAETLRLLEQLLTGDDRTEEWDELPQETEELDME